MKRPAVFAGTWYPGTRRELETWIDGATPRATPRDVIALMAPHAGFKYSGAIAAETYARVNVPSSAIVLCPNHRVPPPVVAIWSSGSWTTPLGEARVDEDLARAIVKHARGLVREDTFPHEQEHAVELQVPFLQRRRSDVKIVPIVVAPRRFEELEALGKALAAAVREHPALIVASSDMNHHESAEVTKRKDELALAAVLALDPDKLIEEVEEHEITMCGARPMAAALFAARELGATRAELVRHGHSGEVSGEDDRVVGYAGVLID